MTPDADMAAVPPPKFKTSMEGKTMSKAADTPRKYEAALLFTQHSKAKVIIEAKSLEEAMEKANDIEPDEIDDWNLFDGEIGVAGVLPVERNTGKGHCFFDGAFVGGQAYE
jgi:hypothetical protein